MPADTILHRCLYSLALGKSESGHSLDGAHVNTTMSHQVGIVLYYTQDCTLLTHRRLRFLLKFPLMSHSANIYILYGPLHYPPRNRGKRGEMVGKWSSTAHLCQLEIARKSKGARLSVLGLIWKWILHIRVAIVQGWGLHPTKTGRLLL